MSTVERGNSFRDLVASMLEAAGFVTKTEVRVDHKKVDISCWREDIDGRVDYVIETKDFGGTLPKSQCFEFVTEYGKLVADGRAHRAWLISRGDVSPDARKLADGQNHVCMTFAEFQRKLLGVDGYLHDLIASFETERIADYYIKPHTEGGEDIESIVRVWIEEPGALPLAIVAGYGKGKSTFARHFAVALAREALKDQTRRVPILVPLGDIADEQSLEGLLGKVLTDRARVRGYNYGLFDRLNRIGRFVIFFDGFDEMKHGMTLPRFERNITEIMRLDHGDAKVLILGRDTAFHNEIEFRSIIEGRQVTAAGQEVTARDRRPFKPIHVRDFSIEEARHFVQRYFPIVTQETWRGSEPAADPDWIRSRTNELLAGSLDNLLARPVHAQMLCQIATDHKLSLAHLSKHRLFDRFVHYLIDREVRKHGRDPALTLDIRRKFNRSLALWLWMQGGASNISLASVPAKLCHSVVTGLDHDYDDISLRKELTAGCLVDKAGSTIYFGHRSLQEFLVAEEMMDWVPRLEFDQDRAKFVSILDVVNPEVANFIAEAAKEREAIRNQVPKWMAHLSTLRDVALLPAAVRLFVDLVSIPGVKVPATTASPWFTWIAYFATNDAVAFTPKNKNAISRLTDLCGNNLGMSQELDAAVLYLAINAVGSGTIDLLDITAEVLALWLKSCRLIQKIGIIRGPKPKMPDYIKPTDNFLLWSFLHSIEVAKQNNNSILMLKSERAARLISPFVRISFVSYGTEQREAIIRGLQDVTVEVTAVMKVFSKIGFEDRLFIESMREFLSSREVYKRLRPLEVEIRKRPAPPLDVTDLLYPQADRPAERRTTLTMRRSRTKH